MGNKDKNKDQGDSGTRDGAMGEDIQAHRMPTMPIVISATEAIAREMAKAHMHYQALLNETDTAAMPTCLKMTSGALGFKVMDPFDWTKDKAIYQRWQLW